MKYVPNCISIMRILLACSLVFLKPLDKAFFLVYLLCTISDILDGYIARKTKNTTALGAKLDSVGDFIMVIVVSIILYPYIKTQTFMLVGVIMITILKLLSIGIAYFKFKQLGMLHTYGNKLTGFLVFLVPFSIVLKCSTIILWIIWGVALIFAIEEFLIQCFSKRLELNIKGIWEIEKYR